MLPPCGRNWKVISPHKKFPPHDNQPSYQLNQPNRDRLLLPLLFTFWLCALHLADVNFAQLAPHNDIIFDIRNN